MPEPTVTCLHCGHNNAIHRVWCERCNEPIPNCAEPSATSDDAAMPERRQLYQRLLADLETLLSDQQVARDTYTAIKDLYQRQLSQIEEQVAARRRANEVQQLVLAARQARTGDVFNKPSSLCKGDSPSIRTDASLNRPSLKSKPGMNSASASCKHRAKPSCY